MMSSPPLTGIEAFVAVVNAGSFVGAAQTLQLSTSAVSRAVARLEGHLGVRLLHRNTRKIAVTDEGRTYHLRCERLLQEFAEANETARTGAASAVGKLRVDVPVSLGRISLLPHLGAFLDAHPRLELQLMLNDRVVDLLQEAIDAAVRIGELADSRLVARKVASTHWVTAAAPSYLDQVGAPRHPRDLARRQCVNFVYPTTGRPQPWTFARGDQVITVEPTARLLLGNAEAAVDAATLGLGIVQSLDFLISPALRDGRLRQILPGWVAPGPPISVVYPSNRFLSSRVQAFAEFVRNALAR